MQNRASPRLDWRSEGGDELRLNTFRGYRSGWKAPRRDWSGWRRTRTGGHTSPHRPGWWSTGSRGRWSTFSDGCGVSYRLPRRGAGGEEQGVLIPNTVQFKVDPGCKALEVVAWIAVSIVTLGSGIVAWIVYHFIIRDMLLPTVVVEAYPTEVSGVARVLVGGPPKYRDSLQEFVASLPTAERVSDSAE
jgi:hypothetical protein